VIGPTCERAFLTRTTVYRAREICIGIVSADVVLAGTDFGGARLRFARDSPLEGAVHCELVSEVKIPAPVTKLGADSGRVMG
jgi:hypothetical protein